MLFIESRLFNQSISCGSARFVVVHSSLLLTVTVAKQSTKEDIWTGLSDGGVNRIMQSVPSADLVSIIKLKFK